MRKAVVSVSCLLIFVNAQTDIEKDWRFGFIGDINLSWMKPDVDIIKSGGVTFGYGYGLVVERILATNGRYSLTTGLYVHQFGGKLEYKTIVRPDTLSFYETSPTSAKYSLRYVHIPVVLKMRTNEIGNARYFIGFGFAAGFRWKSLADIQHNYMVGSETKTLSIEDSNYAEKTTFFRINMEIHLGMEYNMTGSTWLIVSAFFNNGLTNIFSSKAKAPALEGGKIKNFPNPSENDMVRFDAITNFAGISVGFLF